MHWLSTTIRTGLVALLLGSATTTVTADDLLWQGAFTGIWDDADRWLNLDTGEPGVPGPSDQAVFSEAGGATDYFVRFQSPGVRQAQQLRILGGDLSLRNFSSSGIATLELLSFDPSMPSLEISGLEGARLDIDGLGLTEPVAIHGVHGAIGAAEPGRLSISDIDSIVEFSGVVEIGGGGPNAEGGGFGSLTVLSGRFRSHWLRQGNAQRGIVLVRGADARLEVESHWTIGYDTVAEAVIDDDGHVSAGHVSIGLRGGSEGVLEIEDGGSIDIAGSIDVGVYGEGVLFVSDASHISIGASLSIGVGRQDDIWGFPEAIGDGHVSLGAFNPTVLTVGNDLAVGLAGTGLISMRSVQAIDIGGDLVCGEGQGTLFVQFEGPETSSNPIISVGGSIDPMSITLSASGSSYRPKFGDEFVVVTAPTTATLAPLVVEFFGFQLPESLQFLRRDIGGELQIRVVRRGDIDGDGIVGFSDLAAILAAWGICEDCPADLNGDGAVFFDDLTILLNNWGS